MGSGDSPHLYRNRPSLEGQNMETELYPYHDHLTAEKRDDSCGMLQKTTKNYARAFEPTMTREQWNLLQVTQQQKSASRTLSQVFTALLEEEMDSGLIDELSEMLDARKKQLKKQENADSDPSDNI